MGVGGVEQCSELRVIEHVAEPVGAQQDEIACKNGGRYEVDVDVGIDAECLRQDMSLWEKTRVFGGVKPFVDQLLCARVIASEYAERRFGLRR